MRGGTFLKIWGLFAFLKAQWIRTANAGDTGLSPLVWEDSILPQSKCFKATTEPVAAGTEARRLEPVRHDKTSHHPEAGTLGAEWSRHCT